MKVIKHQFTVNVKLKDGVSEVAFYKELYDELVNLNDRINEKWNLVEDFDITVCDEAPPKVFYAPTAPIKLSRILGLKPRPLGRLYIELANIRIC